MIIAIDPGAMNGLAVFDEEGELVSFCQLTIDELIQWFIDYEEEVSTVVIEDYRLYKKRAIQQSGSNMPASRVIGQAEMFAKMKGAELVKQRADILPTGQKLTGIKMPSDHSISHQFSAMIHGAYWLIKQGRRKTALERGEVKI